jgi:hypothetical protein
MTSARSTGVARASAIPDAPNLHCGLLAGADRGDQIGALIDENHRPDEVQRCQDVAGSTPCLTGPNPVEARGWSRQTNAGW